MGDPLHNQGSQDAPQLAQLCGSHWTVCTDRPGIQLCINDGDNNYNILFSIKKTRYKIMRNIFCESWKVITFQHTTVTNFIAIKMVLTAAFLRNSERRGITMAMHIPQAFTNVITKIYILPLNSTLTTLHFLINQRIF